VITQMSLLTESDFRLYIVHSLLSKMAAQVLD